LPVIIAYSDKMVDRSAMKRVKNGLLSTKGKTKAETLLNLFKLTGFDDVPADFEQVMVQTRQVFPPPPELSRQR
jgi:hypothetical protein